MGAAWAIFMASVAPAAVGATVIFYGSEGADFGAARAAYLGHFAEVDEWEPLDGVRQMETVMGAAGRVVSFFLYRGAKHWFAEADRPEYDQAAADLAWARSYDFLRARLGASQQ
jgi:carboxymethylenebutenolidase